MFQYNCGRYQLYILIPIHILHLDCHSLAAAKIAVNPLGFEESVITMTVVARQDSSTQPPNCFELADTLVTGSKIAAAVTDYHNVVSVRCCNPAFLILRQCNLPHCTDQDSHL